MTVPQPDPADRPAHDPWAARPVAEDGTPAGGTSRARPAWGREIRDALLVALPVAAVSGVLLGMLWWWRAPRVPLVSDGEAVLLVNSEGQQAIGADGTFLLCGLAIGAVAGIVTFLLRRTGGVGTVLGLAAGALLGSWIAWRLGVWLGPTEDILAAAREAGVDQQFDAPLDLSARGMLLGLPFAALATHLLGVSAWGPRDEPPTPVEHPHWREPQPPAPADGA